MTKNIIITSALSLALTACSVGGGGSSDNTQKPNSDPNNTKAASFDSCRLKSSSDLVATKFEMDLTSHGREVYSKLFDAQKACSATDSNCLARSSGDIIVAQFEVELTSSGREVYSKSFDAYKACSSTDVNCLVKVAETSSLPNLRWT